MSIAAVPGRSQVLCWHHVAGVGGVRGEGSVPSKARQFLMKSG